jgi:hypothetical protein
MEPDSHSAPPHDVTRKYVADWLTRAGWRLAHYLLQRLCAVLLLMPSMWAHSLVDCNVRGQKTNLSYELALDLNSSKSCGVTVPPALIAHADEVIKQALLDVHCWRSALGQMPALHQNRPFTLSKSFTCAPEPLFLLASLIELDDPWRMVVFLKD